MVRSKNSKFAISELLRLDLPNKLKYAIEIKGELSMKKMNLEEMKEVNGGGTHFGNCYSLHDCRDDEMCVKFSKVFLGHEVTFGYCTEY
jgi:hypothetical protein